MNRRTYIKQTTLMLGYAVSAGSVLNLLNISRRDARNQWEPVFLNKWEANTIAEIAETILPRTSTPGAKDLGVPQFIDKMLKELLTEKDQQEFQAGITDLDNRCQKEYGHPFVGCNQQEREAILTRLDIESPHFPPTLWGIVLVEHPAPVTFFRRMKSLTLMGYFTSEKIGKEVLGYDPVPGKFIGCMPAGDMNCWSE